MGVDIRLAVVTPEAKAIDFGWERDYTLGKYLGYGHWEFHPEHHELRGLPAIMEQVDIQPKEYEDKRSHMTWQEFEKVRDKYEQEYTYEDDLLLYTWPYDEMLRIARGTGGLVVFWFND
jgi:hypothetical protein